MRINYKRLERQARAFTEHLRPTPDCPDPVLCGRCFSAFAASLDAAAHAHLCTKCPELYDALMRFILREHIPNVDECKVLSTRIRTYQANCPICATQPVGSIDSRIAIMDHLFPHLYDECCITIAACIDPQDQDKSHARTRKRPFRSGYWPDTPERLLPLGVEQTVACLIRLATGSRGALLLLSAMLQRYRYHVFKEILNPENDSLLVRRVIAMLGMAAHRARSALDVYHNNRNPALSPTPTPASDVFVVRALGPYNAYVFLLRNVTFGVDAQGLDLPRFILCYEAPLYRAVVRIIECLSDISAWEPRLPDIAISMFALLDADDRRDPPMFIRSLIADGMKRKEDMHAALANLLPAVLARRSCSGPTCGKQVHETASSRPFAKCARCKVVQYCSKECQRADWKWESEPHKEMCDILCEIFVITSRETVVTASTDAIASAWRDGALPPERARRLIYWITGREPESISAAYTEVFNQSIGVSADA